MSTRGLLALSAVVASVVPAAAQPYGPGMGWGGGYWPLGMFIWPVILVALVVLVVWAVRSIGAPHAHMPPPAPRRSPGLDVLEERYARGEIGRDEYLQKKADLGG
jgi:putative membrane protein